MAEPTGWEYDELRRAMAQKTDSSKSSRRSSRASPIQNTRRHSARVEKPRSYHPSPRTPERRRNLAAPRHYSAMEDHYRRMMGLDEDDEQESGVDEDYLPSLRPVSWHPASTSSYRAFDKPSSANHSEDPSPTSHYLSYHNSPFHQHRRTMTEADSAWSQYMHGRFDATSMQQQDVSMHQDSTSWFNNAETQSADGRISSTWTDAQDDYDDDDYDENRAEREPSVELVGLGLYDKPGFTVKIGSKLEEECEPPEFEPFDDDEEDSSEEEEEELPKPEDTKVTQTTLPLVDMSGRSFFLGPDEGVKTTWWSNADNKQPSSHVSAVNYGWI